MYTRILPNPRGDSNSLYICGVTLQRHDCNISRKQPRYFEVSQFWRRDDALSLLAFVRVVSPSRLIRVITMLRELVSFGLLQGA